MKEKDVNNLKIVSDDENIKIIIDGKEIRFVNSLTLKIKPGKFRTAEATLYISNIDIDLNKAKIKELSQEQQKNE